MRRYYKNMPLYLRATRNISYLHSSPEVNMEGALYVVLCALLINSCICTATTGRDRPKPHEETLLEKDHTVNGEHNTEYDHEAFLGDMED